MKQNTVSKSAVYRVGEKLAFDAVTGAVDANEPVTDDSIARTLARLREMDPSGKALRQTMNVAQMETPHAAGAMAARGFHGDAQTSASDTWAYARKLHRSGDVRGARQMFKDLQTRDPQGFQQQYAAYKAQRQQPAGQPAPQVAGAPRQQQAAPQVAAVRQAAQKAKRVAISGAPGSVRGVLPGGQAYVGVARPQPKPQPKQMAGSPAGLPPTAPTAMPGVPGAG